MPEVNSKKFSVLQTCSGSVIFSQMSGDQMTLPLTKAKSFGQKAMVVIHYQVHNRSRLHWASRDRSATVRKKSAVFDHWPGALLLNKTLANPAEQGYLFVLIYFSPGRPCTSNRLSALSTPWFSSLFGVLRCPKTTSLAQTPNCGLSSESWNENMQQQTELSVKPNIKQIFCP